MPFQASNLHQEPMTDYTEYLLQTVLADSQANGVLHEYCQHVRLSLQAFCILVLKYSSPSDSRLPHRRSQQKSYFHLSSNKLVQSACLFFSQTDVSLAHDLLHISVHLP